MNANTATSQVSRTTLTAGRFAGVVVSTVRVRADLASPAGQYETAIIGRNGQVSDPIRATSVGAARGVHCDVIDAVHCRRHGTHTAARVVSMLTDVGEMEVADFASADHTRRVASLTARVAARLAAVAS